MKREGRKVPPTSLVKIRDVANYIRQALNLGSDKVNMVVLLESVVPQHIPNFSFEVVTRETLGKDEARAYPDENIIQVREDIYIAATDGNRREQFTLAHELGHLVLHAGLGSSRSYARSSSGHKPYEDSEWQADNFAAEFLMPFERCRKLKSKQEIFETFGVSTSAATKRFEKIH